VKLLGAFVDIINLFNLKKGGEMTGLEIFTIILGIAFFGFIVYHYATKPKLTLAKMEDMVSTGEADGKPVENAAYWTNQAITAAGVANTVQRELNAEKAAKEAAKTKALEDAEKERREAKEAAEALRQQAKKMEEEGEKEAQEHEGVARMAKNRLEKLRRLDDILNPKG